MQDRLVESKHRIASSEGLDHGSGKPDDECVWPGAQMLSWSRGLERKIALQRFALGIRPERRTRSACLERVREYKELNSTRWKLVEETNSVSDVREWQPSSWYTIENALNSDRISTWLQIGLWFDGEIKAITTIWSRIKNLQGKASQTWVRWGNWISWTPSTSSSHWQHQSDRRRPWCWPQLSLAHAAPPTRWILKPKIVRNDAKSELIEKIDQWT